MKILLMLSGETKEDTNLHSGVSLEGKSKKSKARVHYHKVTRGKDLTRYSEKDLANIFGKKSLKNKEKASEVPKPDDLQITEVVFTEKGSMEDYFKSKLAMKRKITLAFSNNSDDDGEASHSFQGFAGTDSKEVETDGQSDVAFQGFSFYEEKSADKISEEPVENLDHQVKKKSKKNKKSKKDTQETQSNHENQSPGDNESEILPEENKEDNIRKKKCKKIKHKNDDLSEEPSRKKKHRVDNVEEDAIIQEHNVEVIHVPKKKKKRKNKDKND